MYKNKYNTTQDPNWLGWFVGFSEGDGYFGINEGKPVFVLTQKNQKFFRCANLMEILKFGVASFFFFFFEKKRKQVKDLDGFLDTYNVSINFVFIA